MPLRPPVSLSEDEALVLALRLRDGVPDRIRPHREDGVCRYARHYPDGGCDWCAAIDAREAAVALQPEKVVSLAERRHVAEKAPATIRRIA